MTLQTKNVAMEHFWSSCIMPHICATENNEVMRQGSTATDKADFIAFIPEVRNKALNPDTIMHAFRDRGIWPFNPDIVLDSLHKKALHIPELQFLSLFGLATPTFHARQFLQQQFALLREELKGFLILRRNQKSTRATRSLSEFFAISLKNISGSPRYYSKTRPN